MYREKTEITTVPQSNEGEITQTTLAPLSDFEVSLIGGGMGDVQQ